MTILMELFGIYDMPVIHTTSTAFGGACCIIRYMFDLIGICRRSVAVRR